MMRNRLFVDIHCLETVPPCNMNRDDTGAPKTAIYGGVTRARVSSQAWKKAVREDFKKVLANEEIGFRTRKIVGLVKKSILNIQSDLKPEEAEKKAIKALTKAGLTIKDSAKGTGAVMLISQKQADKLAELILDKQPDAMFKEALRANPSVDMALFGRMVAKDPSLNYDAAVQVAHAISTHAITTEFDYFTAVDDLSKEDSSGAGHVGVREFNSSTLYRYASVNVMELYKNLGPQTPEAVVNFIQSFLFSIPAGMKNSYANNATPCSVYIALRDDQPVSMASAYEQPVPKSENGYEKESQKRLVVKAEKLYKSFVKEPYKAYVVGDGLDELSEPTSIDLALSDLKAELTELLPDREA